MMWISNRVLVSGFGLVCAGALLSGCATGQKNLQPVNEQQVAQMQQKDSQFLKGLSIVEEPALEPEWADFVKANFPNWRRHYWVDRGQWGNRGYIVGAPPGEVEPKVATPEPFPPAVAINPEPPTIAGDNAPPKIDTADKPTKYVVKKGDSLWKIAGKVYHNPLKWPKIYRANKEKIKHPNKIYPNQVLVIPWD
jgi:nucleoid-associated protein YgaU